MKEVSLADLVELSQQSLAHSEPSEWLREQLEESKPINSVAKGAYDFLIENNFDGWLLLSVLQQPKLSKPLNVDAFMEAPEVHRGWGRRAILGVGALFLLLVMYVYLKFGLGS